MLLRMNLEWFLGGTPDTASAAYDSASGALLVHAHHGRTTAQIVFRFALEVGMIPLTGTTDAFHIQAALDVFDFCLEPEEVDQIQDLVVE